MKTGPLPNSDATKERGDTPSVASAAGLEARDCTDASSPMAAYGEYCEMVEAGKQVDLEEFCRQFPVFEEQLHQLIKVHQFAEDRSIAKGKPRFPEVGDRFADFQLVEELGKGSFGKVFRAEVPKLGNRQVVVKISTLANFEAQIQGPLEHPNIVPANWVAQEEDSPLAAIMMPYLGRATLEHLLRRVRDGVKPLTGALITETIQDPKLPRQSPLAACLAKGTYFDGICFLAEQVARALAYLHEQGVQHHDLKPSNVLVTPSGQAMLMDFNLSEDAEIGSILFGGTLHYMSPEHLRTFGWFRQGQPPKAFESSAVGAPVGTTGVQNQPSLAMLLPEADRPKLDPRTDLFSLGVILYELLAGQHPFCPHGQKLRPSLLHQYLLTSHAEGFAPLAPLCPEGDERILCLVERCLAFRADDRPASAVDVADTLASYLKSRREKLDRRSARVFGSRRLVAALAVAASLLLVSGFGLAQFLPFPAANPNVPGESSAHAYRQGEEAFAKEDFATAHACFERAFQANPDDLQTMFALARASQQLGEKSSAFFVRAETEYYNVIKTNKLTEKQKAAAWACMGYCLHHNGMPLEIVVDYYTEAIKGGFQTPEILNNLGRHHSFKGHPEEAKAVLTESLKLATEENRSLPAAHFNRAAVNLQLCMQPLASKNPQKLKECLQQGKADVAQALKARETPKLFRMAAQFCILSNPESPVQRDEAYHYVVKALDCGVPITEFTCLTYFEKELQQENRFKQLASLAAGKAPLADLPLLLDPLRGSLELPAN